MLSILDDIFILLGVCEGSLELFATGKSLFAGDDNLTSNINWLKMIIVAPIRAIPQVIIKEVLGLNVMALS
jgi:hypothetical protein